MKNVLTFLFVFGAIFNTSAQFTQATPNALQASTLGGGGHKPIFTDNTGTLIKNGGPFYKTIPAADFDVTSITSSAGTYTGGVKVFGNGEIYSIGTYKLIAPIYLPFNNDQSNFKITAMTACVLDNSANSDLQITAFEVGSSVGIPVLAVNTIGSVISNGSSANYRCFSKTLTYPVDYTKNSYYLELSPKNVGGTGNAWDPVAKSQTLVHVILEYTYN